MFLSKVRQLVLGGLTLCAMFSATALFAEDKEPVSSDRLLPPGVLLHVRISDVTDLKERLPKTGFGKMYNDDSMAKIRTQFDKKFQEASEAAGKDLGFPLSDLLNLPTGEASFALLQPAGRPLAAVALMEIGEQQETLDKALAKLDEALTAKGSKKKTETVDGEEVTVYDMPHDATGSSAGEKGTLCYFTKDGIFVGGSDLAVLQDVLTRWDGESDDVLAEQEVYSYIHKKCATRSDDEDSVMEMYFDPMGLVTAALNASESTSTQAMMFSAYLPTLGLDKFKGVGVSIDLAEGGYDFHSKGFMYVDQPTTGVLRAFEFPATDLSPPAWVGAATTQYTSMNWDAAGAYTALTEMADTLMNQPGAAAQQVNQMAKQLGFHVKDDLIDHLDGQIVMLGDISGESDKVNQKMLVGVKLKDSAKFQETLSTILQKNGSHFTERDFEGTKVYDLPANAEMTPALAVAKDHFFFATHADLLESALRPDSRSDETLAESKKYLVVKKLAPSKASMVSYSDQAKQMKPYYEMLKNGKLDGATEGKFDFSVLPDFEKVAKFFSINVGYYVPDEKGVYSEGFMFGSDK